MPCSLREANAFVAQHHRHHKPDRGHKFSVALAQDGKTVAVAIVGRPKARHSDDGQTLEVTRLASDGTKNACSMLYGAAWRVAKALGYRRLLTYTLGSEPGHLAARQRLAMLRPGRRGELVQPEPPPSRQASARREDPMGGRVNTDNVDPVADADLQCQAADCEPAPAPLTRTMGALVLDEAQRLLGLREDAAVNADREGVIRSFFLDALGWRPDLWDRWQEKRPNSPVAHPEWCAAFVSHCLRVAALRLAVPVPFRLSASASDLAKYAAQVGRFVPAADALTARLQPGDLVVWHGHVGVLAVAPDASGAYVTIEGNTWRGSPRADGVYRCKRNLGERRADGAVKLVGFLQVG